MPQTATAVLTTSDKVTGSSDGWAQLPSGRKVWVSTECRTQLAAASVPVVTMAWPDLSAVPDAPGQDCGSLVPPAPSPTSSTTATAILTTADKSTGTSDGWAQTPSGQKVWISTDCRSRLAAAGVLTLTLAWPDLSVVPDGPGQDCSALLPTTPAPAPGGAATAVLTTADKTTGTSDGWARLPSGSKVWISTDCRSRLIAAGVSMVTMPWSDLSRVPDAPGQDCDTLLSGATAAPTTSATSSAAVDVLRRPEAKDNVTTPAEAAAVAQQITATDPTGTAASPVPVDVQPNAAIAVSTNTGSGTVQVPSNPAQPTTIGSGSGAGVAVNDPSAATATPVVAGAQGIGVYNAQNTTMNASVVTPTGVQKAVVITAANAPHRYDMRVTLSSGQQIQPALLGGFQVVGPDGTVTASVAAPWARDADGKPVPTHYELNGDVLTQVVDFTPATSFPVTADPFWSVLGSYVACITGIGVPLGLAAAFVSYVTLDGLYWTAVNQSWRVRVGGPPIIGTLLKWYARPILNQCRRFIRS